MEIFKENLISFIAGGTQEESVVERTSKLINKSGKSDFDFTFPSASKIDTWRKCAGKEGYDSSFAGLLNIECDPNARGFSDGFIWPISEIQINNNNVFLKLDRTYVCASIIKQICNEGITVPKVERNNNVCLINCELGRNPTQASFRQLSQLRVNQICSALGRLLSVCNFDIVNKNSTNYSIKLGCSDQSHMVKTEQDIAFKVGQVSVHNSQYNQEYFNLVNVYTLMRENMMEIALEREPKDSRRDVLKRSEMVASSELQMLLLAKNIDRPVILPNLESASKTPSNASFILYNYARINQLVHSFKLQKKKYGDILPLNDVDFSCLKEPEEWSIIFNIILPYKELLTEVSKINLKEKQCSKNINKYLAQLCALLSKLSNVYSRYYRRVRVLREGPQSPAVIQTLNARLYLILAVKICYDHIFTILGIQSIDYM